MGFDQARAFLAKVVPWDGKHYVALHKKNAGYTGINGTPFLDLGQVAGRLEWQKQKGDLNDYYIAMSSQVIADTKIGKTGKKYLLARRTRENAAFLKSFWLDIDVKPDKPNDAYATPKEAIAALAAFLKATSLPKPNVVVSSGTGGYHVYWTLTEPITTEVWQPWAIALATAARKSGLKCDAQCTVDNVRLLRVPETFNAKRTPHLPVKLELISETDYLLSKVTKALEPFLGVEHGNLPTNAKGKVPDVNDELSGGIGKRQRSAPRDVDAMAKVCPFIAETLETGGANNLNPSWFNSLALAYYCKDTDEVSHRLSDQHHGYHPDETAREIARIKKDRDEHESRGPPRCSTIARDTTQCATCPNLARNSNPVTLTPAVTGPHPASVAPDDSDLPQGFYRDPTNRYICTHDVDDDGIDHPIVMIPYPIESAWTSPAPWLLHFTTSTTGGGVKDVNLPYEAFATNQSASVAFKKEGMSFTVNQRTLDFMASFIRKLQDSKDTVTNAQAFGWYEADGKIDGFVYDGVRYTPGGNKISPKPDTGSAQIYTPEGIDKYWMEGVRIINRQKRPSLDAILASAFAAPLMKLIDHPGATIGGWSTESGVGKTTALKLAQGVWGSPSGGILGLGDTSNALFKRAGIIRNLPLMWDEIKTEEQTKNFTTMMFQMSGGTEKTRLKRDTSFQERGKWKTLMVYTSNASMLDAIVETNKSSNAGEMRVFEFRVPPGDHNEVSVTEMSSLIGQLDTNFGWAGKRYAEFLGTNHEAIREKLIARGNTLESKYIKNNDERLWLAVVNAILSGAAYANQLGLAEFDLKGLHDFLISELQRMQGGKQNAPNDFSRGDNILTHLNNFLAEKRARNTLYTDSIFTGTNRATAGTVKVLSPVQTDRMDTLHVQLVPSLRNLRFSDAAFSEWLQRKHIPRAAMMAAMTAQLNASKTKMKLGAGTLVGSGSEPCWEIDGRGAWFEDKIAWGD